jgi:heat shock protein HslJ
MRRSLLLAMSLLGAPVMTLAQIYTDAYWQLLAINGTRTEARATLRIDKDNVLAGAAPCNRWSGSNGAVLPALALGAIRSTRMACDRLAEEQAFFEALAQMTAVALEGERNLILSGPDGRTMEFVPDGADNASETCKTCAPSD